MIYIVVEKHVDDFDQEMVNISTILEGPKYDIEILKQHWLENKLGPMPTVNMRDVFENNDRYNDAKKKYLKWQEEANRLTRECFQKHLEENGFKVIQYQVIECGIINGK